MYIYIKYNNNIHLKDSLKTKETYELRDNKLEIRSSIFKSLNFKHNVQTSDEIHLFNLSD